MRRPLMWMGLGAWVGAIGWHTLRCGALPCLLGAVALAVMSLGVRTRRVGAVLAFVGGMMLGGAACALSSQANPPVGPVQATLLSRSGQRAQIQTGTGIFNARFSADVPAVGTRFAALTTPARARPVLPGAIGSIAAMRRAGEIALKVQAWIPLDGDSAEPVRQPLDGDLEHRGIIRALSTGDRSEVPNGVRDLLRRTGTIHLLAISGLHVGLVAAFAGALMWLLTRPLSLLRWPLPARVLPALAAVIAAASYGQAVGWPVSTRRAAIMVAAGAAAAVLARKPPGWNLWGLALLIVVLNRPSYAGDLGLCLSFGAVAGLLGWGPVFARLIQPHWWVGLRWFGNSIAATTAAVLGTLPISAWVFQELALIAPLANVIATPLLAGIAVPAALLSVHGGMGGFAPVADTAIGICLTLLSGIDRPPMVVAVGPWGALALACAIPLARFPPAAALLLITVLSPWRSGPDGLQVVFPDVGQGAAALVSWPDGRHWLVDGGGPSRALLAWLRRQGIRKLDAVFLTHPQQDHMGGLVPILEGLQVSTLWAPRRPRPGERAFRKLWRDASLRGVELRIPEHTDATVLHPDPHWALAAARSDNDLSLVLSIRHGKHRFLLMGDIEADAEALLAPKIGPATVVQVPHHGSRTSSTPALVEATGARWAVVQCGKDNRYGHPHPLVVQRWRPKTLLRTDKRGTIRFQSDGEQLQIHSWLPETGWTSIDQTP